MNFCHAEKLTNVTLRSKSDHFFHYDIKINHRVIFWPLVFRVPQNVQMLFNQNWFDLRLRI